MFICAQNYLKVILNVYILLYPSPSSSSHVFVPGFNVITLDLNALDLNDLCHNGICHSYDLNTHTHTSLHSIRLNAYAHILFS